ncbi:hypothetical protein Patl1_12336 [Pistacia atlantica]|uniref:Uncharacterized protein n=1 Tax=Pistacia atlantica TaxID=434234 RepID=A0ACC1A122_9ROSI|nr:hypothetical protein Patl1_12336 [Pistacia atlantica]
MITSANSFELYARDLSIDWAEKDQHWHWTSMEDTNGVQMEMAELVEVCWLDVKTNFPTQMLTPGTSYEVSFVLKAKGGAEGFAKSPVTLKLDLPNQKPVERTEDLSYMQGEKWKEIRVGEFGLSSTKFIIRPTTWKVFSGKNYWGGLLEDPHVDLRKYITFYGERVDAIYDSINDDKTDPSSQDRSTWIGYVAVATDYGVKVLGRRDILVCWRGTSSDAEWIKNFQFPLTSAEDIFPFIRHPTVHQGFHSIYTTPKSASKKTSARDQVFEEVRKWVNEYQNEEVSITVTGHSLGAALATMNVVDMVSNGYNMPISNPNKEFLVTAFAFASPKVGDVSFQTEFNNRMTKAKLRLLRIENNQDVVTILPPGNFVAVGYEIPISTTNASADEGDKLSKAHSLKNYIRELVALSSTTPSA